MKRYYTIFFALVLWSWGAVVNAQTTWQIGYPNTNDVTATLDAGGTLTIIGTGAMQDFPHDESGTPTSPWYEVRNSINTLVIQNGVTNIGNQAFVYCKNLTSVTISNSVKSIGRDAFSVCSGLKSITIPNSVTTINEWAFFSCGLTSVSIPNSVTAINRSTFQACKDLASVTIPNSVLSIGDGAFALSGLTSISIPGSVKSIGNDAFYGCSGLTTITIPNSVITMGNIVFYGCTGLKSVTIGNSVSTIGNSAFFNCTDLTTINVDASNPNFCSADGVLFNKDKTILVRYPAGKQGVYTIPNSVNSVLVDAFGHCKGLTTITIPNSVTSIGYGAFSACYGLTSLTIPISVTSIGDWAFSYCWNLTDVYVFWMTSPSILYSEYVFYAVGVPGVYLHIPQGTLSIYQDAPIWQNFLLVDDITGVKQIPPTSMKIYPNPVKEELKIESGELQINSVEIVDLLGKTIYKFNNSINKINVSELSQGIYFVKMETDKRIITKTFVKK
jgi:Flp pilus assembly protein protease CpaA